ncbi:MAG: LysR family transcriptional regulator, partial [Chloroflexota bacterium]
VKLIGMSMTLHQLQIFTLVYEKGSFNQAGHTLYLSQAAISQHIQKLERHFGVTLFERTYRGVKPTAAGETLYDYATQILSVARAAEEAVVQLESAETRSLIVGATSGVSVYLLPAWLKAFQASYPNINLSIKTEQPVALIESVRAKHLSFALFVGDTSDLGDKDLKKIWLQEIEYMVAFKQGHVWEVLPDITHLALAEAPFLNRQPNSRARLWLDGEMEKLGIVLNNTAELDNPGVIKYALLNELGVAILPAYAVERELERGELVAKRLESGPITRPLMLVWEGGQGFTPVEKAFLKILSEDFPNLQQLL